MCLIVVSPKREAAVTKSEFEDAFFTHSDGSGLMFTEKGKVEVWKPYWNAQKFYFAYLRALNRTDSCVVLHFRQATHGKKNKVNTHPHLLHNGQIGMVHNGILPITKESNNLDISDTVIWARYVFDDMPAGDIFALEFGEWRQAMIGNKLVFLRGDGETAIFGETFGTTVEGRWYSNRSHVWARRDVYPWMRKDNQVTPPVKVYGYSAFHETYNPVTMKWEKWHR